MNTTIASILEATSTGMSFPSAYATMEHRGLRFFFSSQKAIFGGPSIWLHNILSPNTHHVRLHCPAVSVCLLCQLMGVQVSSLAGHSASPVTPAWNVKGGHRFKA